jgi:ketosteroid isomerase-like protein
MRRVAMLVVAMMTTVCGLAPRALAADTKTEIAALERKCLGYLDVDQKMTCYSSSDDLVVFGLTDFDSQLYGFKQVRASFQRISEVIINPSFEIINLEVISEGNFAVAISTQHVSATFRGGHHINTSYRVTDVWRKEADGWKIVHAHSSYPINARTGRANIQGR